MKKVPQSHGEQLKPVKIYFDDLKEIIDILKTTCKQIKIQTEEYLLDDLNELSALKKEILHSLTITGLNPYICLDMTPYRISLYINEDSPESRGLFEKIKEILVRRRRRLASLLHNPILQGISLPITIWGLYNALKMKSPFLIFLTGVSFLLCIFWWIYGNKDRTQRYTIIIPKYRIESPGFLKRNKDSIIVGIISALTGALITYILTYFFK